MDADPADRTVSGTEFLRVLGTWIAIAALSGGFTWLIVTKFAPTWQSANEPVLLIVAEVYASLPIATLLNLGWSGIRDRVGFRFTSWRDIGLAVVAWLAAMAVGVLASIALAPVLGTSEHALNTVLRQGTDVPRLPTSTPVDLALILFRALVLSGIAEEFLFRGLLFSWLRRRLSTGPVVLITAILFALQHYFPAVIVVALSYGLAAGWVRARTRSTLNTFVMHVLADSSLLLAALLLIGT
jgi:membrane protease YdiL (CAAX protease family)